MRIKPKLVAALLSAFMSAACLADDASIAFNSTISEMEDGGHRFGATIDGVMTWWVVRRADVANTPDWSSGAEPPLSLDNVDFVPIGNPHMNEPRKWFYVVTLEREYMHGGQRFDARGTLTIPVLVDGRVIQGVQE